MSDSDKVFAGSIPELYDTYLVPLILENFASGLACKVAADGPKSVLETASGSGVVTRALAPKLGADCSYVVTDLNQPMLDRAASRQGDDGRIAWQQADAMDLPFDDQTFDAVCCQFGVMFFPDRIKGYREARRVLRPGGQFVFNVWDHIEENEFANLVTRAAGQIFPEDPPLFLARTPHGYHDIDLIHDELRQAGFGTVEIGTITDTSWAPTARHPAIAYCQGTPLRNELEARDAAKLAAVTDRSEELIVSRFGPGPVSGKIQGHVIVART